MGVFEDTGQSREELLEIIKGVREQVNSFPRPEQCLKACSISNYPQAGTIASL